MSKYTICVTKPEYWQEIHETLCGISSCEHVPDREVICCDEKLHSPTRGTFELDEHEAEALKNHEMIEWIELSPTDHPEAYPKPQPATKRFKSSVKIYRDLDTNGPPTTNPTQSEDRRTNWAIKRVGIKTNGDFWSGVTGELAVKNDDVSYSLTGKNVDIVIHDSGVLQYHPEFLQNNGQSRVRDIVLDGPYHIDPSYFDNVIPGVKYTKADGRVGIATTAASEWWGDGTKRSAQFASIGTITIPGSYTQNNAMGIGGTTNGLSSGHGTACAGLAAGKNMGLAFEANIWNMPGISDNVGMEIEANYNLMKLFHKYKPVNPQTGVKNPTVVNGSWTYQAGFYSSSTVQYQFRGSVDTFIGNAAVTNQVTAMKAGLVNQVLGAHRTWSTSSRSSSTNTAADEMMAEGVIYVAAAGNYNQRLGIGVNDPDRFNYMSDTLFSVGDPRFGGINCPCNHRDWMNPHGIGFDSTNDFHPVICVGAMDDTVNSDYSERKAFYSNNGPGIDVWAPADETLAPGTNSVSGYEDYQRYDDTRFYDCYFNGTSAAAPVVAGLVAVYLQTNPKATSVQVKDWLKMRGSVGVSTGLYQDQYIDDTTTTYWTGQYNMRGAEKRILYNPYANDTAPLMSGVNISGISFSQT
jgi:hypothetical protein